MLSSIANFFSNLSFPVPLIQAARIISWPLNQGNKIFHRIIRRVNHEIFVQVENVPSKLICNKCNQLPQVPKVTNCGKIFCRSCLRRPHTRCPDCNSSTCLATHSKTITLEINSLTAKCPNSGPDNNPQCIWQGRVDEVVKHLQDCKYVKCPDCGKVVLKEKRYVHTYVNQCPRQRKKCFYCPKEGTAEEIDEHELTCTERNVPCPNECGDLDIRHDQIQIHLQRYCPLRPITCTRCFKTYKAEDFSLHHCIPQSHHCIPRSPSTDREANQPNSPSGNDELPERPASPNLQQSPPSSNTAIFPIRITNFSSYLTCNDDKSKAEVFQRLVVSYIVICLMSLIGYLRNQRNTDVEFVHDMEIPSMLLWSIFTSAIVFLVILGGLNCFKNYFKAINTKEWIAILLLINFLHLIRFYSNNCTPVIVGSVCGSTLEVYMFLKYIERNPGKFTQAVWVMTQFVTVVLAPFVLIYYNSISPMRLAIMQLVYIIYIVILKEKQWIELRWEDMTQENRTMCVYLINGTIIFSITIYSVIAISYEVFSTSCDSLKIMLMAVLPIAYLFVLAKEGVQDLMINFGMKLYNSSIYSFWGRACMVAIIYYTMTFCLIIPIVQETGDFTVGSALASILIVYSLIVQSGLLSKNALEEVLKDSTAASDVRTQYTHKIVSITKDISVFVNLKFEEINRHITTSDPNTLNIYAELEKTINGTIPVTNTSTKYMASLSVVNNINRWNSANEMITFFSHDVLGDRRKPKLGTVCLVLHNWERYLTNNDTITIEVELTQETHTHTLV